MEILSCKYKISVEKKQHLIFHRRVYSGKTYGALVCDYVNYLQKKNRYCDIHFGNTKFIFFLEENDIFFPLFGEFITNRRLD